MPARLMPKHPGAARAPGGETAYGKKSTYCDHKIFHIFCRALFSFMTEIPHGAAETGSPVGVKSMVMLDQPKSLGELHDQNRDKDQPQTDQILCTGKCDQSESGPKRREQDQTH